MAASPRVQPLSTRGVAALALTKGSDLATTLYGLMVVDGLVETNPIAASILRRVGPIGLVLTALVGTGMVVVAVEWGTNVCRRVGAGDRIVSLVYAGGYTPLICLYGVATVHNTALVLWR